MKSLVSNKGMAYAPFAISAIFSCIAAVYPHSFPVQPARYG